MSSSHSQSEISISRSETSPPSKGKWNYVDTFVDKYVLCSWILPCKSNCNSARTSAKARMQTPNKHKWLYNEGTSQKSNVYKCAMHSKCPHKYCIKQVGNTELLFQHGAHEHGHAEVLEVRGGVHGITVDGTYSLLHNGWVVIVMGTTSMTRESWQREGYRGKSSAQMFR